MRCILLRETITRLSHIVNIPKAPSRGLGCGPLRMSSDGPLVQVAPTETQVKVAPTETLSGDIGGKVGSPGKSEEVVNQESTGDTTTAKRPHEENSNDGQTGATEVKKAKTEHDRPFYKKKKKVAMLLVYSGKGYTGMQMNPGMKTIEQDLLDALLKAGVVTEDHASKPGTKMGFQRAARTDKGVSAAGQVVSLKHMFVDVPNLLEKINSHLADQIRALGFKRVTRGFSSKDSCSSRTYMYLLPTFAFTPVDEFVLESFKMSEELRGEVNKVLGLFIGTHKFHNFTSGKKPNDASAQRYIMDMSIGEPFLAENVEYAVISVRGQSFMLHQIRKMIGLTIAIVRGLAGLRSMEYAWRPEKADVPMAPGLGLMLDQLHYDAYNARYGNDGMHEAIEWEEYKDQIEAFKHKHIYKTIIETEKEEKSMMRWLATLHHHHFEPRNPNMLDKRVTAETKVGQAFVNIIREDKAAAEAAEAERTETSLNTNTCQKPENAVSKEDTTITDSREADEKSTSETPSNVPETPSNVPEAASNLPK